MVLGSNHAQHGIYFGRTGRGTMTMMFKLTATKYSGSFEIIYGDSSRALKKKVQLVKRGYTATVSPIITRDVTGVWS